VDYFNDMFKNSGQWPVDTVLAINSAWGASNPDNWSQTIAQLKTAPFETRDQVMAAISGYPSSSAVYGTIDTWLFDPGLTSFRSIFSNVDMRVVGLGGNWPYTPGSSIASWDLQYVTDMNSMFEGCTGLEHQSIVSWDVSNVTDMSSMFKNCMDMDQDISNWDVSKVTDMSSMFEGCTDIPDGLRQNIQNWTVGNVDYFNDMFKNSGRWPVDTVLAINAAWGNFEWIQNEAGLLTAPFETPNQVIVAIDLWYTSPATYADTYGNMSSWDFASTLTDFSGLFFRNGAELTTFNEDISGWDVSNVTNMSKMFKGCSSFNRNLASWGQKVGNVTDMTSMFEDCTSMDVTNQESLKHWNVSSVGVTAVNNSVLWSVDYVFQPNNVIELPVSGNDDGRNWIGPNGQSYFIYQTFTGQDGFWNKLTLNNAGDANNALAKIYDTYGPIGLESCLQDGNAIYKAESNVTHTLNGGGNPHQTYSPRTQGYTKDFAGFDVISTKYPGFGSAEISSTFDNLPPGTYDLRLYGQPHKVPSTGITSIYNWATFSVSGVNGYTSADPATPPQSTTPTYGYVTFTNLSLTVPGTLGFKMSPASWRTDPSPRVYSWGGVQLKRTYQVSKFKDMFKGSSWQGTSATVINNIDPAWGAANVNWYKNEAKLSE
jgi:surface protein